MRRLQVGDVLYVPNVTRNGVWFGTYIIGSVGRRWAKSGHASFEDEPNRDGSYSMKPSPGYPVDHWGWLSESDYLNHVARRNRVRELTTAITDSFRYGRTDATLEQLEAAAKALGLDIA